MSEEEKNVDVVFIDLQQTNGQIMSKAFRYKVTIDGVKTLITVISPSATIAKIGISNQFPNMPVSYDGVSDLIMQVNDQGVINV